VVRELAARDQTIVCFFVDVGLVGGGRERPDAQADAQASTACHFLFFVIFDVPENAVLLWLYFVSNLNVAARKLSV
jgi:hypothetical protein